MSTPTTLNVVGMPHAAEPRGARWAAALWHAVASFLGAAPKALSRAQEAAEVREMARHLQATDPGFAADLYAAADRHEVSGR
ncbi:MAG: hypothetical protein H6933_18470 [Burkholderiaceae bacterium]|nr:hypothetical protein [Rhodoferax sp.]MCP5286878.1 hypothetical protein [Burkholderiaceae bacterium]